MKKVLVSVLMLMSIFFVPFSVKADTYFQAWVGTSETVVGGTVSYVFDTSFLTSYVIELKYDEKVLEYIPTVNKSEAFNYKASNGVVTVTKTFSPTIDGFEDALMTIEFKAIAVPTGGKTKSEASISNAKTYSSGPSNETDVIVSTERLYDNEVTIKESTKECPKCEECNCSSNDSATKDDTTNEEKDTNVSSNDVSLDTKDIVLYSVLGSNTLLLGIITILILRKKKNNTATQVNL